MTPKWTVKHGLRRFVASPAVRYLIVGGFSFVLDLGLLAFVYKVVGAPLWIATAAGFWGSFAANFWLQRRVAFRSSTPAQGALLRYVVLLGVNTGLNILVVGAFEHVGLGYVAGKVTVTVLQTVWNYFAYRWWVFPASPGREI